MRSTAITPAVVAAMPKRRLTMVSAGTKDRMRYLPANRSFMNCSISETQTRPSAPFVSM
jgi:hypothetical protein